MGYLPLVPGVGGQVSAPRGVPASGPEEMSAAGGVPASGPGGVPASGWGCIPACNRVDPTPPPCGQNDRHV